jgi:mRNA interferase MazF
MRRGDIWWAALPDAMGAGPGFRRPVVILQADSFTRSAIKTVIVVVITKNLRLAAAPGNVVLPAHESGLPNDSVINVSQVLTVDKQIVEEYAGILTAPTLEAVEQGLRIVLDL